MARLASCWLLVESFVIPHGFHKWFYLSFYVHPIFLAFCQVFLWLNELMNFIIFLFYPLKTIFRLCLFVFGCITRVILVLFSYIRPAITKVDVFYDALAPLQDCEIVVSCKKSTISPSLPVADETRVWRLYPNIDAYEVTEEINLPPCVEDSWLNEYLYSDHYSSSVMLSCETELLLDQGNDTTMSFHFSFVDQLINPHELVHETDQDSVISPSNCLDPLLLEGMQDDSVSSLSSFDSLSAADVILDLGYLPSYCSSDSPTRLLKQQLITSRDVEDIDPFQTKYTSRMGFFNALYLERLHGINAIMNEQLSIPVFSNCIEQSRDLSRQYKLWSGMARKRVLRSLECDLEIVCVAQSCLFWEALDHQFHKVHEAVALSSNENITFHNNISGKFQELQIHLERFVEDQRWEGRGSSNNTSKRLSFQSLLQVPDVTGFVLMEEENEMLSEEYCTRPTQILEAIEKCIKAFWSYINTTDVQKKVFWRYKRTHPPVEDPLDLGLLYEVVKNLDKKELMLRGLQGKSKCWMRRKVKPMKAENEKRNLLFAMIDMKLVQKIIKMSLVSKSQLNWCQEKLDNLDFIQDRVCRGCPSHLFPSS